MLLKHLNSDRSVYRFLPVLIANPGNIRVEGRLSEDVIKGLEAKGWEVSVYSDYDTGFGGANAILIDPEFGTYAAASDPRREGYSLAW